MNPTDNSTKVRALWETTSRLLATVVNEGLVKVCVAPAEANNGLQIQIEARDELELQQKSQHLIRVRIYNGIRYDEKSAKPYLPLSPQDLQMPVTANANSHICDELVHPDPGALFNIIFPWLGFDIACKSQIIMELNSSARFQAQTPLKTIEPEELSDVQKPRIVFISIPRKSIITVGPFEELLDPLVREHEVDRKAVPEDRIILPCLERQLPSVVHQLATSVSTLPSKALHGRAQSSLRTISLPTSHTFHHDLKLALACNVSSALRTITPWTALIGPEVSAILDSVLPSAMWVCHELAAVTGSGADFDKAKHCSVLIRENLEAKARANVEALIVSAALAERGVVGEVSHAERLFGLHTEAQKEIWFRHYTSTLLSCTLPPIYQSGVSLEAHGQNILSRFHIASKTLVGFAYRDYGGLKLHTPTLSLQGFEVKSSPPGSLILTDNVVELWENCHHTIFQSHLNQLIQALRLRKERAWAIVRQELDKELNPGGNERAKPLYDFLMQDMVPYKCFLRMKMQGLYRDVGSPVANQVNIR
ncbi:MAG: hypothetical protein Q9213_004575 [Squamulea squamosa]